MEKWLVANKIPGGSHADTKDTSTMIYLGQDKNWVRMNELPTAVGDPKARPGNGISGDARPSNAELGKRVYDNKVTLAAAPIQKALASNRATGASKGHLK